MEIPKPSEQDKAAFTALVPDLPGVVVKPMFGNLGAFVNGNMFMGLFGASIGLKLSDADAARLLSTVDGTGPFGPAERPMGGYVAIPSDWRKPTKRSMEWVARSVEYVAALPPKSPKKK
jgi:TfoX/Sxy family transcriptional regulator of competence genes